MKKRLRDIFCKVIGKVRPHKRVAFVVAVIAATFLLAGGIPFLLWPGEAKTLVLEWLKFAAYLVGGGLVVWQLRISDRRALALEKTAALGEKGNITERFKSAIEHLAHEMDSVQIGGIYTLYHIAKEAEEYRDAVLKVLLAHLRKISAGKKSVEYNEVVIAVMDVLFVTTDETPLFEKVDLSRVNLKEFACGTVLGFNRNLGTISKGDDLDLTEAFFANIEMCGATLLFSICDGTDFSGADVSGCDFSYAETIEGAIFEDAVCIRTSFENVKKFDNVVFTNAYLDGASFQGSSISAEHLMSAKTLYGAQLPDNVREEIMRQKPELLDPPTEEEE